MLIPLAFSTQSYFAADSAHAPPAKYARVDGEEDSGSAMDTTSDTASFEDETGKFDSVCQPLSELTEQMV